MDADDLEERIEEFKHKHESDTEWNLRKTFMLTHMDKYPLNRLICLAACFINYECYGCTYPGPVMVELKELMEEIGDVLEEHRTTITQARQLQFVKSSGEIFEPYSGSKKSPFGSKKEDAVKRPSFKISKFRSDVDDKKRSGKKMKMTFVKASDDYSSTDVGKTKDSDNNKSSTDPWMSTLRTGSGVGGAGNEVRTEGLDKKMKMNFVKASDDYSSPDVGENKDSDSSKGNPDPWMSTLRTGSGVGGTGNKVKTEVSDKKMKMNFVKESDDYPSSNVGQNKVSHSNKRNYDPWMSTLGMGGGAEVSAENEVRSELLDKFYTLKGLVKQCLSKTKHHPVSALHMAANKAKLSILANITESKSEKGKYDCLLQIDYVDIATATAKNKRNAKTNAYEQAIAEFSEPYLKIEKRADGRQILEGSQAPFSNEGLLSPTHSHVPVKAKLMETGLAGVTKLGKATSSNVTALAKAKSTKRLPPIDMSLALEEFLIVEHGSRQEIDETFLDTTILRQSADFNRMSLDYDFRLDTVMGESRVRCLVSLQGNIMAEVEGISQQNAKHLASTKCMERLRQMCWTIQIKQAADSADLGLSREQVLGDIAKTSEAIPESNIGNKLLKAMGWTGGGVGKKGTGIAEPVNVEAVINREGLGLKSEQGFSKNFFPAMKSVVLNYAKSSDQNDLVFSPDFTKDERASIHKICQQMNLKTRSYGVGDERYLVASRRRTPNQLFNHILESGGETSKYVLKPPGYLQ